MILAGDIGGTNARLAYFQPQNGNLRMVSEAIFPSREFGELGEIVSKFLKQTEVRPQVACFGIAGPVRNGRVETSNLPWVIEQSRLAEQIHMPATLLINDLEAAAWGIAALSPADLVSLNSVPRSAGNQAVIAPGTGLGQAGLFWDGSQHRVFACEGGHCDFGPQDELQIELLRFLEGRYEHVSYERVVSGPGLVNIYEFLCTKNGTVKSASAACLPDAAEISGSALKGTNPLAGEALDLWLSIYGAEAGNLALKTMATGGIFLGGGISPKSFPNSRGPYSWKGF